MMRRRFPARLLLSVLTLTFLAPVPVAQAGSPETAAEMDWPHWRGPEMNGISREKNIPAEWSPDGENLLWKREDLGSRSTPIVMNGKLYLILRDKPGTIEEGEKVVCLDAKTGETIWENSFNVFLSDVPDTRVGWSAVTGDPETGNVFALGVCGLFQCLDGETGETIWKHSLSEEYGLLSTYGGRTNYPIVFENLVIVSAVIIGWGEEAKPNHRFMAFDVRNGQPVWTQGTLGLPEDTTYSAPVLATIDGQTQLIFGGGEGSMYGFAPRTGQMLWDYPVSGRGINTTPLVADGVVYAGHSEENLDSTQMGALFAIKATQGGRIEPGSDAEVWRTRKWFVGKSSPLLIDGRLYAIEDKAQMLIVNPETGEQIAKQKMGTMQRSSPLFVDGKIYVATANGRWYTFKPTEDGVETLYKMRLDGEVHGSCIVSHGKLYVPTTEALYCVGFKDENGTTDPRPEPAQERPVEDDLTPATVQIVPAEALLSPGQKQQYQVRLYNKNGQFLVVVPPKDVTFKVEGAGRIDENGKFFTPEEKKHQAVTISATVNDITGSTRCRIVPDFPWSFDFDDGQIPVTWVGARYRHTPIDFVKLQKLKDADPVARDLYVILSSSFVNSGRPALQYNRSTVQQTMSAFLRFLALDRDVTDVESAKAKLDGPLAMVKDAGIISGWEWGTNEQGLTLDVQKGEWGTPENGVMMKITTIPKGARSQAWMGQPDHANYTIQADVYGATKNNRRPDIGLIGQRYTLDMMGESQQLQIRTWPPQLRMAKTIPFEWEPYTWYTMKLRASVEDGKAVLRGKVWKKGEAEPAEWMIEAVDPRPNTHGSPGLFGNAKDAEIFYDNLSVTSNDS